MNRWLVSGLLSVVLLLLPALATSQTSPTAPAFDAGVEAYRRGAYAEAQAHWLAAVEEPLAAEDRAQVAYCLGNAALAVGGHLARHRLVHARLAPRAATRRCVAQPRAGAGRSRARAGRSG